MPNLLRLLLLALMWVAIGSTVLFVLVLLYEQAWTATTLWSYQWAGTTF